MAYDRDIMKIMYNIESEFPKFGNADSSVAI